VRLERVELLVRRQSDVHARDPVEPLREVLDDGADGKRAERGLELGW
jgi:hypothetical protein